MEKLKNGLEKKNKRQKKKAANTKTSGKYRDSKAGTATNGQMDDCRRANHHLMRRRKVLYYNLYLSIGAEGGGN